MSSHCQHIHLRHLHDLWNAVAHLIRAALHVEGAGVLLLDENRHELFVAAASFEDAGDAPGFKTKRLPADQTPFKELLLTGTISIVHDFTTKPPAFQEMDRRVWGHIRNRLDVPLRMNDTIIGTLWAVNRKKEGAFDAHASSLLCALAAITASAGEAISGQRSMIRSDPIKEQVVHHLSHAVKTPLAVLIASLKLLEKHLCKLPGQDWKRVYHRAQRNLDRLLTLEYEMEDILRQSNTPLEEKDAIDAGTQFPSDRSNPAVSPKLLKDPRGSGHTDASAQSNSDEPI